MVVGVPIQTVGLSTATNTNFGSGFTTLGTGMVMTPTFGTGLVSSPTLGGSGLNLGGGQYYYPMLGATQPTLGGGQQLLGGAGDPETNLAMVLGGNNMAASSNRNHISDRLRERTANGQRPVLSRLISILTKEALDFADSFLGDLTPATGIIERLVRTVIEDEGRTDEDESKPAGGNDNAGTTTSSNRGGIPIEVRGRIIIDRLYLDGRSTSGGVTTDATPTTDAPQDGIQNGDDPAAAPLGGRSRR